jgi:hypothetical protein
MKRGLEHQFHKSAVIDRPLTLDSKICTFTGTLWTGNYRIRFLLLFPAVIAEIPQT